jgi:hypothetical protein
MPIENTHQEYAENEPKWKRTRDVLDGADAIKVKNEVYLPRLSGQTEQEYLAYKDRTPFWNATARTHEGLVGMLFRKEPEVVIKENLAGKQGQAMKDLHQDADLKGNSLEDYARKVAEEILGVGRGGTLVDFEDEQGQPYFAYYAAEDIWNWRSERIGGGMKPTMIVLHETLTEPNHAQAEVGTTSDKVDQKDDPFEETEIEQLRVLRLIPVTPITEDEEEESLLDAPEPPRKYVVEIWRKVIVKGTKKKKTTHHWELVQIKEPTRTGKSLEEIPFIFHGADDSDPSVDRPPLDDMIEMNLDHYRTSADYKHGMHFTALPTAWVAGFGKDTILRIGSTEAWVSDNPEAKAGYLEFEGKGLSEFNVYLGALEAKMAVLGARMLEQQKREAETAEAMHVRQGGEISVLQHIAGVLSTTLTSAMKWAYWWTGTEGHPSEIEDEDCMIGINTDFVAVKLPASDVVQLVSAWIQGGISRDSLHWNLAQGERLPPGRTSEEELELIEIDSAMARPEETEPVNTEEEEPEE